MPPATMTAYPLLSTPPRCLHCNRHLRRHVWLHMKKPGEPDPKTYAERKIAGIVSRKRHFVGHTPAGEALGVWLGHWGHAGDNRFCTKACGYRWAIAHSEEAP